MSFKAFHISVSGRVQGVGFRVRTKLKADRLGLVGWVKNLDDGRVEILAEGEEKNLNKLVGWIKSQPLFSKVEKMEISEEKSKKEFNSFEIIR